MITNYKKIKEEVLKLYDEFLKIAKEANFVPSNKDKSMEELRKQAENIRKDKFALMVAGEAKSGKSTFINAYLGEDILPMDIKQCTSSIVEIHYGEKFTLTATYANGIEKTIVEEEVIKKFLLENASLNDDYRDIPVNIINSEILIKYKGKNIPKKYIEDLINGVQTENIYNLNPEDYERKIRTYIQNNRDKWEDIVVKMKITYPFKDESLNGVEIIDSPGVNADGRVGDVTESYIKSADAIMFLKPITGQALESTSFKNFINSSIVDRNKSALFLVLTRAANETKENQNRIHQEALKQFRGIDEDHIVLVDSKVEMFVKKIQDKSTTEIKEIFHDLGKKGQLEDFILLPWYKSGENKEKYIEILREKSNFKKIEIVLNRFGRKSHYILLSDFLGRMHRVYEKKHAEFEQYIELNKKKMKDPVELEKEIEKIKNQLLEIENKMHRTIGDIQKEYTRTNGIIMNKANERFEILKKEINEIKSEDMDELEKISFKKIAEYKDFQDELQKNIVAKCNEALVKLSKTNNIPYIILEPDFTPDTFKNIIEETENEAYEDKEITEGKTFKKTHTVSYYSQNRHFKLVKDSIISRSDKIKNNIIKSLVKFVRDVLDVYYKELIDNANIKQQELDKFLEEKKTNEEIKKNIDLLESYIKRIEPEKNIINEIKGGIDNYVQS